MARYNRAIPHLDYGQFDPFNIQEAKADMNARRKSCSHLQCSKFDNHPRNASSETSDNDYQPRILVSLIACLPISPRVLILSKARYLETMNYTGRQYADTGPNVPFSDVLRSIKLVKVGNVGNPQCVDEIDWDFVTPHSLSFKGDQVHQLCYLEDIRWYTRPHNEFLDVPKHKLKMK